MIYEIILFLMIVLDLFGVVYIYKLLIKYSNKKIEEKREIEILGRKENTAQVRIPKTTISNDIKFESERLCDKLLRMLDAYR